VNKRTVVLQRPHFAQREILGSATRFNHLRCGRRFGKTSLIATLASKALEYCPIAGHGKYVGIFYPIVKDSLEVWKELRAIYKDVTKHKSEVYKQLVLINGGVIDFWSLDDPQSGQGRKYHRVIIDESAKVSRLIEAYSETIRPTLTDYQGDAFFMSRPRGYNNDFFRLEDANRNNPSWSFFHYTTYDNPYIPRQEIEEAKNEYGNDPTFQQEYMAEYVDMNNMPFFYNYSRDIHSAPVEDKQHLPVHLSFDFNIDPMTCLAYQAYDDGLNYFMEIKLENSDIFAMCDYIKAQFSNRLLIVTGDRSGKNRSAVVRGKTSFWKIIREELDLAEGQLMLRGKNLDLITSRILTNIALKTKTIRIDPSLTNLHRDLVIATVDGNGQLVKDRGQYKMDFGDCFRYSIDAEWPDLYMDDD